ncbi:hypothetical protein, partial [Salmonella enterica]|uniref:hypothetical protein n=1 Tax=Salmonella enterica TaxID=28901 RepID=UPI001C6E02FB
MNPKMRCNETKLSLAESPNSATMSWKYKQETHADYELVDVALHVSVMMHQYTWLSSIVGLSDSCFLEDNSIVLGLDRT